MILLQALELHRYKAVKYAKLAGMRDLNIFVGPNNCGKTSILAAMNLLAELRAAYSYKCQTCQQLVSQAQINAVGCNILSADRYLHQEDKQTEICFSFNEEEIEKLAPGTLSKVRSAMTAAPPGHCENELRMKGETTIFSEHISPFAHRDIIELLNKPGNRTILLRLAKSHKVKFLVR